MAALMSQFIRPSWPTHPYTGQTVIVTGSNTGLGKEASRHFARLGASKIILAVRNTTAGEEAKKDILSTTETSPSTIEVWPLDLSSFSSVKAFASRATSELSRIDVLLNNAGIAPGAFNLSQGHERSITVNVISTFLLSFLLLPKLKASKQQFSTVPRITIVTSDVHTWVTLPERDRPSIFAALDDEKQCVISDRYPTSKLLEVLVVRRVAPKLKSSGVVLNMVNPGLCHSELARDTNGLAFRVGKFLLARSTEVGSRTFVLAASAGEESHGMYFSDGVVKEWRLSEFVRSEEGAEAGEKVWKELKGILEDVQEGVTGDL